MTPSKIFFCFCLAFLGGIFFDSFSEISQTFLLSFLILGTALFSVFWKYKKMALLGFCVLFFSLGIFRHQTAEFEITNGALVRLNDNQKEITLTGIVSREADVRENNMKLILDVENPKGKALVTAGKYPSYQYGDKLKITGFLKAPKNFEDFNYQDYLLKDGICSLMDYPEIELLDGNQGNFILAKVFRFKEKLREVIYQNLSPPQSSILGALILGDKRQISKEWLDKLNYAGVRHITAVSGMHIVILTGILMGFLTGLGLWRKQVFYCTLIFIIFFIILTGFQSSAVRAGIMGGILLASQYLGRMNASSRSIVFVGFLMLLQNPFLLKSDIGFQLSFLAVIGIIHLLPIFQFYLRKMPDFFQLKNILLMTLSAQVFTLPLLLYNFGYFSLISPITNILLLPVLPFIMGFGFLFAISGIIFQPLGWIFSLPLWLLSVYLIKVVDLFSNPSFSLYDFGISWFWLPVSYLILGLAVWHFNQKQKLKFLNY